MCFEMTALRNTLKVCHRPACFYRFWGWEVFVASWSKNNRGTWIDVFVLLTTNGTRVSLFLLHLKKRHSRTGSVNARSPSSYSCMLWIPFTGSPAYEGTGAYKSTTICGPQPGEFLKGWCTGVWGQVWWRWGQGQEEVTWHAGAGWHTRHLYIVITACFTNILCLSIGVYY